MRIRRFASICLIFSNVFFANTQADESQVIPPRPKEWSQYLEYDQGYNVGLHKLQIMSPAARADVPVYYWDIASDKTRSSVSNFLNPKVMQSFQYSEDGRTYTRFFMVDSNASDQFKKFSGVFGNPTGHVYGTKVQSHNTFFVWDPDGKVLEKPVFLKMYDPNVNDDTDFARSNGGRGKSDLIELRLKASGDKVSSALPEHYVASINGTFGEYTYVMRESQLMGSAENADDHLLPGHGLLGNHEELDLLAKNYAKTHGLASMTSEEWFEKEYIPNLAKFNATLNLKHGVIVESHLQNLLIQLDPEKGEITHMNLRDMADMIIEPKIPLDLTHYTSSVPLPRDLIFNVVSNSGSWEGGLKTTAGDFSTAYLTKSLFDFTGSHYDRQQYASIYLKEYQKNAEAIVGAPLKLSNRSEKSLKELREWTLERDGLSGEDGIVQKRLGSVIQDIYDQSLDAIVKKEPAEVRQGLKWSAAAQISREEFEKLPITISDLSYFRSSLLHEYAVNNDRIVCFEGKKIIAYSEALPKEQLASYIVPAKPPAPHCGIVSYFKSLF